VLYQWFLVARFIYRLEPSRIFKELIQISQIALA